MSFAMECPNDRSILFDRGHLWYCSLCQGHFHHKNQVSTRYQDYIRNFFTSTGQTSSKSCPGCRSQKMGLLKHNRHGFLLDQCQKCQGLWFNSNLFFRFQNYARRRLGQDSDPRIADQHLRKKFEHHLYMPIDKASPGFGKAVFQVLTQLPLEIAVKPSGRFPVTKLLVALNVLLFFISASMGLEEFFKNHAFIPGQSAWFPNMVTSMFLHGGLLHLLGNMYFLWVVGDNVEDFLGSKRYLIFYLLGGLISFMAVAWGGESIPHVGASGAISAVMGAYVLLFPRARFGMRFFWFFYITISARTYVGFWFGFQVLALFAGGDASVSWLGHIAGFLAGIGMTIAFKRRYQLEPCSLT